MHNRCLLWGGPIILGQGLGGGRGGLSGVDTGHLRPRGGKDFGRGGVDCGLGGRVVVDCGVGFA